MKVLFILSGLEYLLFYFVVAFHFKSRSKMTNRMEKGMQITINY
jgi:hypothetical protein